MSNRVEATELFTREEHAILYYWFLQRPIEERVDFPGPEVPNGIYRDYALEKLGFRERVLDLYSREDAAVAYILLERAEKELPQWAIWTKKGGLQLARPYREPEKIAERKILLKPQLLFTINWADSGPGFSWPDAYYLTWVPYYERYVVTSSADTPEGLGYCDFALGSFRSDLTVEQGAGRIIRKDWARRKRSGEQERWDDLIDTGLIDGYTAQSWADWVWDDQDPEEKWVGPEPVVEYGAMLAKTYGWEIPVKELARATQFDRPKTGYVTNCLLVAWHFASEEIPSNGGSNSFFGGDRAFLKWVFKDQEREVVAALRSEGSDDCESVLRHIKIRAEAAQKELEKPCYGALAGLGRARQRIDASLYL